MVAPLPGTAMPLNILQPAIPKARRITESMAEELMCDPVMAAEVLLGFRFDAFQAARLRYFWWCPFLIDSSGFSTGKTITDWAYIQLRCLLLPEHTAGVYYPVFETGKNSFWTYYEKCDHPIFRAYTGRLDEEGEKKGKSRAEGSACFKAFFRNGSSMLMPAPSFLKSASTQASLRLNTLLVEEWTHVDAMSDGIDAQLIGRVTQKSWNQNHPVWANHIHFTAPAKTRLHPAFNRYEDMEKKVKKGSPFHQVINYNYKDYSAQRSHTGRSFREEYRVDAVIGQLRSKMGRADFLGEGLGLWTRSGKGWYTDTSVEACVALGRERGLRPVVSRHQDENNSEQVHYFMGVDPAPAQGQRSDDGSICILRARPRYLADDGTMAEGFGENPGDWDKEYVYARRVRKASARQWSGLMHQLHQDFQLTRVLMDLGGGGQWIKPELNKQRQLIHGTETEMIPICTIDDATVVHGHFILSMFKRGDAMLEQLWPELRGDDVLTDAAHSELQMAINHGEIAFPAPAREWKPDDTNGWGEERLWALRCLETTTEQFKNILVATNEDGTWRTTRNGARQFGAKGKKDFQTSAMMAYLAFLGWCKSADTDWAMSGEDTEMFGGFAA